MGDDELEAIRERCDAGYGASPDVHRALLAEIDRLRKREAELREWLERRAWAWRDEARALAKEAGRMTQRASRVHGAAIALGSVETVVADPEQLAHSLAVLRKQQGSHAT